MGRSVPEILAVQTKNSQDLSRLDTHITGLVQEWSPKFTWRYRLQKKYGGIDIQGSTEVVAIVATSIVS